MATRIIPVSDLRRKTSDILKYAREDDVVYVTQHGRPAVVLVGFERYEALMEQLEDLADLTSLEAAGDEPARPYAEFLSDLEDESNEA